MAQNVRFTRNRLFVGYRASDWTEVFYDLRLPEEEDNGGNHTESYKKKRKAAADEVFYTSTEDWHVSEAPKRGEIVWEPFYNPATFEASDMRTKNELQRLFLQHAYNYLAEKNPQVAAGMERDMSNRHFRRWDVWFHQAKKFKKAKMQQRKYRETKKQKRLAAGYPAKDADSSDSDSDSAYDTDENRESTPPQRAMGPPARPAAQQKRPAANVSGRYGVKRRRAESFNMTGTRGSSNNSLFDFRAPPGTSPVVLDGRDDFSNRTPPPTNPQNRAAARQARQPFVEDGTPDVPGTWGFGNVNGNGNGNTTRGRRRENNDEVRQSNVHEINGMGLSEEDAFERAVRESTVQTEGRGGVVPSIERDGYENGHENGHENGDGAEGGEGEHE
ncbi:uncharacterized protein LTR77_009771 [Saxophila tyrrhenica]|uniref:Uncharacterized protein n=1 Tax=Saxophila tyrrhenica TaxID=1690608 RepID=A0AAV9P130_9PEZI|nr:hypothetical protein LTR77_009771 [Saxophila tyrrhenica]